MIMALEDKDERTFEEMCIRDSCKHLEKRTGKEEWWNGYAYNTNKNQ